MKNREIHIHLLAMWVKVERTDSSFHQYLYFDDYRYWMTREPEKEITVIYRQKASQQK